MRKTACATKIGKNIHFDFLKSLFYILFDTEWSPLKDGSEAFCLQPSFEHREDTLDRIVIRTIWRTKDVRNGHLVHALSYLSASMHSKIVHIDANVLKEVLVSQVLEVLFELWYVHRLAESGNVVQTIFLRDAS